MKKRFFLLVIVLTAFISCNEEKDPCEGLILDPINQTLIIEIIDDNGDNLIENGSYSAEAIFTERNGFQTTPVVFNEPEVPKELKNVIRVRIFGSETEPNIVNIHLNQDEIDVLSMNLEVESEGCSGPFYGILEMNYNQEKIPFQDVGNNYTHNT